ncbi:uncharacterized protein LOC118529283 isoform X2 [Halichoerus grypus]
MGLEAPEFLEGASCATIILMDVVQLMEALSIDRLWSIRLSLVCGSDHGHSASVQPARPTALCSRAPTLQVNNTREPKFSGSENRQITSQQSTFVPVLQAPLLHTVTVPAPVCIPTNSVRGICEH